MSTPELSDDELDRYARHLVLREIGGMGQLRLKAARVLLIGAGGIGAPAALYLAAAGVGTIGLVDDDVVSLSNLQRQVLYATNEVGGAKVAAAANRLGELNPYADIIAHPVRLNEANAASILGGYDLIIDGCDNFETRFLVNRLCVALHKPLISAALGRWSGQLAVFEGRPCYQCFVPGIPPDSDTCERVGVVGALAGIMGSMAALEAIKLITGAGTLLKGQLLIYDGLAGQARTLRITADPACPVCG